MTDIKGKHMKIEVGEVEELADKIDIDDDHIEKEDINFNIPVFNNFDVLANKSADTLELLEETGKNGATNEENMSESDETSLATLEAMTRKIIEDIMDSLATS